MSKPVIPNRIPHFEDLLPEQSVLGDALLDAILQAIDRHQGLRQFEILGVLEAAKLSSMRAWSWVALPDQDEAD